MILVIKEYCAWENERWSYIIDVCKQDAAAINSLMIFMRLANEYFEDAKRESEAQPPVLPYHPLFNRHPRNPFAASSYQFSFYDEIQTDERGRHNLITSECETCLSDHSGYNKMTNIMTDRKISPKRMKSAMQRMRNKKENTLYKCFDAVFLKPKSVTA